MDLAEYGGHLQHIYGFNCLHANDNVTFVTVCYYKSQPASGNGGISGDGAALWRLFGGGTGVQGEARVPAPSEGAPVPAGGGGGGDAGHPDATEVHDLGTQENGHCGNVHHLGYQHKANGMQC